MAAVRSRVLMEVEVLARVHTRAAIQCLVGIMQDEEQPAGARVTAASHILDRGWGKAKQSVMVESAADQMSDEDLARHIEDRLAAIAHRAGAAGPASGDAAERAAEEESSLQPSGLVH